MKILINTYTYNTQDAYIYDVRFEVLTVTYMKMAVFWDVAPCSLGDIN
jgi:hypothetical protein